VRPAVGPRRVEIFLEIEGPRVEEQEFRGHQGAFGAARRADFR